MAEAAGPYAPPGSQAADAGIGRTSALAIWSLVLGLLALCLWITALPGLILGVVALVKIRGSKGQLSGAGLAIAGVVTSGVALIIAPVALAIMIPAASKTKERAEEIKAQAKARDLQLALLNYFEEYGHLPVISQTRAEDVHTASEGGVIQVLLGRSRELNPRGIVFLDEPDEKWIDPWGHPFLIAMDGDADGRVTLRAAEGASPRTFESRVVVWSFGPDGKPDGAEESQRSDDILAY